MYILRGARLGEGIPEGLPQTAAWNTLATNDLQMTEEKRAELEKQGWGREVYHRGLKQCCGSEKARGEDAPPRAFSICSFACERVLRARGVSFEERGELV
ncbi:MAG: hypothetical protein C4292_02830 [Nitrososphaera sp.]